MSISLSVLFLSAALSIRLFFGIRFLFDTHRLLASWTLISAYSKTESSDTKPYFPERSPGSPTIPVMVIIIVPELEFADVELWEAIASILGGASLLAGSAAPGEKAPAKNRNTTTTQAKHRNLTARLNVPSSHPGQGALKCRDLFSQKNSLVACLGLPQAYPTIAV